MCRNSKYSVWIVQEESFISKACLTLFLCLFQPFQQVCQCDVGLPKMDITYANLHILLAMLFLWIQKTFCCCDCFLDIVMLSLCYTPHHYCWLPCVCQVVGFLDFLNLYCLQKTSFYTYLSRSIIHWWIHFVFQ